MIGDKIKCVICGTLFTKKTWNEKYCRVICARLGEHRLAKARYKRRKHETKNAN